MSAIVIRREGRAGRITLNRPGALNALTHPMTLAVLQALADWRADPAVAVVVLDAAGERAFCAGGDIAELYAQGARGEYGPARAFWRDEYRMNAAIARYPKPVIAFLQGFTMGGGVGLGCHARHRIVCDSSRIAMPECSIGLVPDVGGSLLLARAPGRLGDYLALTSSRMSGADAIHAGFADHWVDEAAWPALKAELAERGHPDAVAAAVAPAPDSVLAAERDRIDRLFAPGDLTAISGRLAADGSPFALAALDRIGRNAPLAMAASLVLIEAARGAGGIEAALQREYRYVHRAVAQGDFLEGIRARIIDKDDAPRWRDAGPGAAGAREVQKMIAPLGAEELTLEETA